MVAAWSVDRLGRSMADLIAFLGALHGRGATSTYISMPSTSPPTGRAMFLMMACLPNTNEP